MSRRGYPPLPYWGPGDTALRLAGVLGPLARPLLSSGVKPRTRPVRGARVIGHGGRDLLLRLRHTRRNGLLTGRLRHGGTRPQGRQPNHNEALYNAHFYPPLLQVNDHTVTVASRIGLD